MVTDAPVIVDVVPDGTLINPAAVGPAARPGDELLTLPTGARIDQIVEEARASFAAVSIRTGRRNPRPGLRWAMSRAARPHRSRQSRRSHATMDTGWLSLSPGRPSRYSCRIATGSSRLCGWSPGHGALRGGTSRSRRCVRRPCRDP